MCCTTVKYNEKYCLNLSSTSSPQPNLKITPSTRNQPLVSCCGLIEHLRTFLESKPELFCRIFWNDWSSVFFLRFFFTSIDPIIIMHTFGGGHHSFRPSECSVSHPSFTYMQGECVNHYTKEILEILRTTVADIKGQIYQIWSPSQFGQRERHLSYSMYFIINFSNAPPSVTFSYKVWFYSLLQTIFWLSASFWKVVDCNLRKLWFLPHREYAMLVSFQGDKCSFRTH